MYGFLASLLFVVTLASAQTPPPVARPSNNLAQGKSYTLTPPPAYAHCTDTGDRTQLTDGIYTEGHFWTQPSTVGWEAAKPVIITIDLGSVQPIRGVSLNSAAGVAGVTWPVSIDIFVADEPGKFHGAGDLIALDSVHGVPKPDVYAVHRYFTDALRVHGRYVAFVISAGSFFFADEVEVYAGQPEWISEPLSGDMVDNLKERYLRTQVMAGMRRRMREDAIVVKEKVAASDLAPAQRDALTAKLDAVLSEAATVPLNVTDDFRTVLPLNASHQRVFDLQAEWWRARGHKPVTVWQSGLWDSLPLLADPDSSKAVGLDVGMMLNEYRAASLNVSNASDHAVTVSVHFEGLPGDRMPDYVRTHQVEWTDTAPGAPVAAALPDAEKSGETWLLHIPSGMTRQAWFTFHPVSTPPGRYGGHVVIEAEGLRERVPVALHISPLRFPDRPTLHCGGWDYTDADAMYGVTPRNRTALVALLREHYVDSPWGTNAVFPFGVHDDTGAMIKPPDTTRFDTWLARWPDAARYNVFAAVGKKLGALDPGTEPFEKAVTAWASFWAAYAKDKGIAPERIGVLLVDEPGDAQTQAHAAVWIKAFRAAGTGMRVWEDPVFKTAGEADLSFLQSCDILCPNLPLFLEAAQDYRDLFTEKRAKETALEFYSCSGPVRLLDPYSYFRLQPWACRRYGATASYFWAFGDNGGVSSWNEYAVPRAAFTPLFLDAAGCMTGKHLEACREGIEDYEYFVMLERAVAQGGDSPAAARGRALLNELPARVCDAGRLPSFQWADLLDRTAADTARREMLDVMESLLPRS